MMSSRGCVLTTFAVLKRDGTNLAPAAKIPAGTGARTSPVNSATSVGVTPDILESYMLLLGKFN